MSEGKTEITGLKETVCEAVGCYSTAKIKLYLRVGRKGILHVFVCESCVPKFSTTRNSE
ncbi:MAG: hypothetical protein WAM14_24660 [Candidatus Nitrosopolaris sp.]